MTQPTLREAIQAAKKAAAVTSSHQEVYRANGGGYDVAPRMHGQSVGRATVAIVAPDGGVAER